MSNSRSDLIFIAKSINDYHFNNKTNINFEQINLTRDAEEIYQEIYGYFTNRFFDNDLYQDMIAQDFNLPNLGKDVLKEMLFSLCLGHHEFKGIDFYILKLERLIADYCYPNYLKKTTKAIKVENNIVMLY